MQTYWLCMERSRYPLINGKTATLITKVAGWQKMRKSMVKSIIPSLGTNQSYRKKPLWQTVWYGTMSKSQRAITIDAFSLEKMKNINATTPPNWTNNKEYSLLSFVLYCFTRNKLYYLGLIISIQKIGLVESPSKTRYLWQQISNKEDLQWPAIVIQPILLYEKMPKTKHGENYLQN